MFDMFTYLFSDEDENTEKNHTFEIGYFGCMAGIMDSVYLINHLDSLLANKPSPNKLSHGQAIACLMLYLLQGEYIYYHQKLPTFIKTTAIPLPTHLNSTKERLC